MRKVRTALSLSVVAALGLGVGFGPAASAGDRGQDRGRGKGLEVIGLADDRTLVSFDTKDPEDAAVLGQVAGLVGDQSLVGIDYRVQDGNLYGVGNVGGVYRIHTETLMATKFLDLTVALEGTSFGVDFNPAANALRIISDTGQNLRQPFTPRADGTIPGTAADARLTTNGNPTAGVTGAAYTNNDLDPTTGTTLYDLATLTDEVVIQSPANAGTLVATGKAGIDLVDDTGFDIYSELRDGKTVELSSFAVNGGRLYEVELFNGQFDDAGRIGDGSLVVTDLAIPLDQ